MVVGGIIPDFDARRLRDLGVTAVYTPKGFGLTEIFDGTVDVIRKANGLAGRDDTPWPASVPRHLGRRRATRSWRLLLCTFETRGVAVLPMNAVTGSS